MLSVVARNSGPLGQNIQVRPSHGSHHVVKGVVVSTDALGQVLKIDVEVISLRRDTVFSCNLRFRLIFLHGCSRTHCVASLRAVPVGRISYNLYFDCKHVRSVTCDLINEYTFLFISVVGYFAQCV